MEAPTSFKIQNKQYAERVVPELEHQLWNGFLNYLKTGMQSSTLIDFVKRSKIAVPKLSSQAIASSTTVALPTSNGLILYTPTPGDFFYRPPRSTDGSTPPPPTSTTFKFGHAHGQGSMKHLLTWAEWFPFIRSVVIAVMKDLSFYEKLDVNTLELVDPAMMVAQIPFLLRMTRFFIACAVCARRERDIPASVFLRATDEISVVMLLITKPKLDITDNYVSNIWLKHLENASVSVGTLAMDGDSVSTMTQFHTPLRVTLKVTNRGGIKLPFDRPLKIGVTNALPKIFYEEDVIPVESKKVGKAQDKKRTPVAVPTVYTPNVESEDEVVEIDEDIEDGDAVDPKKGKGLWSA